MQHVRFSALAAVLVLSTVMLTTIDGSQYSVFAQNSTSTLNNTPITPAPETSGGDDELSSGASSDDSNNNDESNNESSSSSGSDDDENGDDSDSQQDTSSSNEEEEDETEDDFDQTNPLLEQIRNNVNGALSASGIVGP